MKFENKPFDSCDAKFGGNSKCSSSGIKVPETSGQRGARRVRKFCGKTAGVSATGGGELIVQTAGHTYRA